MDSLAERLDLECLASAAAADEIVILDRAGRSAPAGSSALPGQRLPLAPPLGTVFVAWSPPEAVDAWLLRLGPDAPPDVIGRARAALATVRARGYSVGLDADARVKLGRALAELAHEPRVQELRPVVDALVAELGHEEYALVELGPSRSYPVNHIAAPVFDSAGAVVLALTVVGFTSRLGAGDVPAYAREVVAAAARVTAAIGGAPPA
jgi:DNA-binding IclR family transcriptional regulator